MKLMACALAAVAAALLFPASARADNATDSVKIEALLKQTGLTYERKAEEVFVLPHEGKNLGDFQVVLANGDGIEVMFVIIAKKARISMTPELAQKMLFANHNYDRVKVGLDDDGDAFVRDDATIRVLDASELKVNINQVAAAADEIYGELKPYFK